MTQVPQGNNMFWDVQSVITVASTSAGTNVTDYNVATMHLYVNFGASSTAANSTGNDIILESGLHSLTVPKQAGNAVYLNYLRVAGDVTMRLVLS